MAKKYLPKIYIALWMLLLIALGVYFLLFAPRESTYSEAENRTLAGFPAVTAENLFSGKFGTEIESYLLDHFPGRSTVISATNSLQSALSFATHDEYLMIAEGVEDPNESGNYEDDLDNLLAGLEQTLPATAPVTQPEETVSEETAPAETQAETTAPTGPVEDPPIEKKPPASLEDYPSKVGIYTDRGDGPVMAFGYSKKNVAAATMVLNKVAGLLPENGKLMFAMSPLSVTVNRYLKAANKGGIYSDWDDVINGLGADNVYAFDVPEILSDRLAAGEYLYFRTDHHWTPYAAYLTYCEMIQRAGKEPCSFEDDFTHTFEEPFRGTYYRDDPAAYGRVKPDALELLMPKIPVEFRQMTGPDEYKVIPFLKMNANKSDRYTVYLGGPGGPWRYIECDNGETENALVLCDSFGMTFMPFLTQNYKQVHYCDPRYFNKKLLGGTIAELMEKYEIQDVYVILGAIHSFNSSFLVSDLNKTLGVE